MDFITEIFTCPICLVLSRPTFENNDLENYDPENTICNFCAEVLEPTGMETNCATIAEIQALNPQLSQAGWARLSGEMGLS